MPISAPLHTTHTPKVQQHDTRETSGKRGYDRQWRNARAIYLRSHPLCVRCTANGQVTAANVIDHITPHKGSKALFWTVSNWQSLCKRCHDKKTATEDGGFGR